MTPKNESQYKNALNRIPWATQTNAKRLNPAWGEFMPPFIKQASGCRMRDMDDREYIDYRCSLGPIILGYRYAEVDRTVRAQMEKGVLFSMASPLELETAEAIMANVPWIEQIRFMKTGADACTACVRLARSYSGREHVLSSGYHGYHDLFSFNWPNPGVPRVLREYIRDIPYGDLEAVATAFDEMGEKLACAIVAPYEWNEDTGEEYLKLLRKKCDQYGTLLIFDEVLTGFRLARGGAQEYYAVTPDLAAYAKAMANGYPLSAFAGKKEYMQALQKTVITTTYAGETLSLAAGKATMNIMSSEPVQKYIHETGQRLKDGFAAILQETGAPAYAAGLPPAPFIQFNTGNEEENNRWQNRLFSLLYEKGIFANDRWFISYSHKESDINETLEKVRKALKVLV